MQSDTQILAEVVGRNVETLSEHVGEVRLGTETKIQGDIENGSLTAAQLVHRPGKAALANILAQRDPRRFFEQLLHMPQ
ncbi:hypothetical protein SESI111939_19095 [Serratia silvae]